jgi:VWFA-related protein
MRGAAIPGLTFLLLAALVAGTNAANPQTAPPLGDPADQPYRISLDLNLVVLPVTVLDKNGGFVSDLREQDFQVYEDGAKQPIHLFLHEDIPVTVGLVIDHSGSMRNKLSDVIGAAHTFVRLSNLLDQMFVVNFSDKASLGLPAAVPFSDRADELETAILQIPAAGETALYDAVDTALDHLKSGAREKKVLVVVSDGGDNKSRLDRGQFLKRAADSSAVIYTVGIFDADDPDQNPDVLRRLARTTGGESFFPHETSEVVTICERIANDIRHQYTIGYVSGHGAGTGQYRTVHVVAHSAGKNLAVRTRTGFAANAGAK